MQHMRLDIEDVILFEPKIYEDKRGYFFESFNYQNFKKVVRKDLNFVQDNHSCSAQGVLRGLHYQLSPRAQGKLVRVLKGEIFDVAVDLRKGSHTFGKWVGEFLSSENKKQLWIPAGFAHGFLSITESTEVLYKTTDYYAPDLERSIKWNDPDIDIKWPSIIKKTNIIVADKDISGDFFANATYF